MYKSHLTAREGRKELEKMEGEWEVGEGFVKEQLEQMRKVKSKVTGKRSLDTATCFILCLFTSLKHNVSRFTVRYNQMSGDVCEMCEP